MPRVRSDRDDAAIQVTLASWSSFEGCVSFFGVVDLQLDSQDLLGVPKVGVVMRDAIRPAISVGIQQVCSKSWKLFLMAQQHI